MALVNAFRLGVKGECRTGSRMPCDYCLYPLVVGSVWRWPLERDPRMPAFHAFPRRALQCGITPPNLFDFAQIRSGNVNAAGGYESWQWHRRDFEDFLGRYELDDAYRAGGLQLVLRRMGLTRMQTDAFMLVEGMGFSQTKAAAALGITQGAVSLRLAGARDRIHRHQKRNLIVLVPVSPIDRQTSLSA